LRIRYDLVTVWFCYVIGDWGLVNWGWVDWERGGISRPYFMYFAGSDPALSATSVDSIVRWPGDAPVDTFVPRHQLVLDERPADGGDVLVELEQYLVDL